MRFIRSFIAVLLLATWPAVTSHSLLERFGFIHQVHDDHAHDHHHHHTDGASHEHEHNSANHDFAHGDYLAKISSEDDALRADVQLYELPWLAVLLQSPFDRNDISLLGPAPPPGVAPPETLQSRNFLLRTAVDARAPSFLS